MFGLRFVGIHSDPEAPDLFDVILKNDAYQLNPAMIETIIRVRLVSPPENIDDLLAVHNYSTVLSSGCMELIDYIGKQINVYVTEVRLTLPDNTKETEEAIINLFNNDAVSSENKAKLIAKQDDRLKKKNPRPARV